MTTSPQDMVAFTKANFDAFTASGKIWAAGLQELTKQFTALAKANTEQSLATFKALTAVKSPKDAIEIQTSYAKSFLASTVEETKKLTDASVKLAEQTMEPLKARYKATVESLPKAA